jgi:hypothetical protein
LVHDGYVQHVAFDSDGRRIVTASWDKTARLWDSATGLQIGRPLMHLGGVEYAAFSPDGLRVVTASSDHTVRVWDAATGEPITSPLRHDEFVNHAVFSPDGLRLVTASGDKTARVWDSLTGRPLTPPLAHRGVVYRAAFSPDGKFIVTVSRDKTARIWDSHSGQPVTPPLQHEDSVLCAVFSPDGSRVVTTGWDKTARVWNIGYGDHAVGDWVRLTHLLSSHRLDENGGYVPLSTAEQSDAFRTLTQIYPNDFTVAEKEILAWHRREAANCTRSGRWESAILHLNYLVETEPGNAERQSYRRDLVHCYTKLLQPEKAGPILRELSEYWREAAGADSPQYAGQLASLGLNLLEQQKSVDAEPILRECLLIREKTEADAWTTFNTKSLLGGSLLGQKNYADAEPLLLAGYEGMKEREAKIPPKGTIFLTEALERIVQLYDAWGKPDQAAEWREKLAASNKREE